MESPEGDQPALIAATVVLLRDTPDGSAVELLLLRRGATSKFGDTWVFPGGKVDATDGSGPHALRAAAVREAREEAGIDLDPAALHAFSHWIPPGPGKRFNTTFFVAAASSQRITIDDGEIVDYRWERPSRLLELHDAGELTLVPPTWRTLRDLTVFTSVSHALGSLSQGHIQEFRTRSAFDATGTRVALWREDAGWESSEVDVAGPRHRLYMCAPPPWRFERSS